MPVVRYLYLHLRKTLVWTQDTTNGSMTWWGAVVWADWLYYGGYTDWRLTTITDLGDDGCNFAYTGTDCGYNVDTDEPVDGTGIGRARSSQNHAAGDFGASVICMIRPFRGGAGGGAPARGKFF